MVLKVGNSKSKRRSIRDWLHLAWFGRWPETPEKILSDVNSMSIEVEGEPSEDPDILDRLANAIEEVRMQGFEVTQIRLTPESYRELITDMRMRTMGAALMLASDGPTIFGYPIKIDRYVDDFYLDRQ